MADTVRKVDYFKVTVANRPGEGARILGELGDSGVNMLAFSGFPRSGKAQLDFIPENAARFKRAAKKAGLRISAKKVAFLVQGKDRPGAVGSILKRLAKAKVNVTAVDAITAGKGRYGTILWVKPGAARKAAKALGAS